MKSSWAIVVLSVYLLSYTAAAPGSMLTCPRDHKCTCARYHEQYDLLCGNGSDISITLTVRPYNYVQVQCTPTTTSSDFDLLSGLAIGPVDYVHFLLCPLPSVPISQLLSSIEATAITSFKFQSHRNLSNTFDRKHLMELSNLTKLALINNDLTELSEDFLEGLPKLDRLDLRENKVGLPKRFFEPVPDLEFLELGGNNLIQVDPPLLSNLTKLRQLNLWKNSLRNITRSSLSGLSRLEELDISSNLITVLPGDVFRDLKSLVNLSLYANNFTSLPPGLLSENINLELFRLHDNHQTLALAELTFANLPRLKQVQLMRNNISALPENTFWGSGAIQGILLQGNSLVKIPQLLFRDQGELRSLDLSENRIDYLPELVFASLPLLETLNLARNRIQKITRDVFSGLSKLESLYLEENELKFIDSESLTCLLGLKRADLSHNRLSFLPSEADSNAEFYYQSSFRNKSPFRSCVNLEYLNLTNNSITEIFTDWQLILIKLRALDLSYNKISALSIDDVHFLGQNLTVDLRHNQISLVDLEGLEIRAMSQNPEDLVYPGKSNHRLLLEGNPINCDCRAYELFRYFERRLDPAVYLLVTLEPGNLKCKLPSDLSGLKVSQVELRELTCPVDHRNDCPKSCTCEFRRYDLGVVVNCTGSGLTEIPGVLPRVGGTNHTELLLDGNYIGKLPNSTLPGYENVTHLHLSSNNISDIGTGMLSRKLRVLTLDDNNLTELSSNTIKFLYESQDIRLLTLHNNPWKCDCSARELLDLIQQKFKEIPHLSNVTCSEGKEQLSKMSVSDLCPVSMAVIVSCIAAGVFGLLVGAFAALYYRYQREVKVWLYSHRFCLWFVTEEELDRDKLYDAFVSYSHKDEHFVVNTLVPELESGENPFKLCLHYRDWIAGEWIPNQIARSVENSRRTLVVLSPNFLESVWSRMEFRAAHKQALSEGRARVIVVLYGDVGPTDDLDAELRAYISMNTYVKWGDPWFWEKLKYALPHPPSLVRTNLNFLRRRTIKKDKNSKDDKLELIHRLDPSIPTTGGTTPPLDGTPNGNQMQNK